MPNLSVRFGWKVRVGWDSLGVSQQFSGPITLEDMRRYIRSRTGSVFFFTLITHEREKFLTDERARSFLRQAIESVRRKRPFHISAMVLLPDHLHAVWTLPAGDRDYSTRWRLIKSRFTQEWIGLTGDQGTVSQSRIQKGDHGIWQRRFYEHTCRDADDVQRCVDYIHVNPLKHRLVERVSDWPWSTFHRYLEAGHYSSDWGSANE